MQTITMTVGIPASSKSTWAIEQVATNPEKIVRINRDMLRDMMSNYHFSNSNEKLVRAAKTFMIKEALRNGRDIIDDETNLSRKNFDDMCKLVSEMNINCTVIEKPFYVELDVAILRDSKRTGCAKVGEAVVRQFWKKSGGEKHKDYVPRVKVFNKRSVALDKAFVPMVQDENLSAALICDLDGTLATIGNRSPYDASNCDLTDTPKEYVVNTVRLHHNAGYKIIFCSGRMEKDRDPTIRFIKKCLPEVDYILLMRSDFDQRKDNIIKEELFNNNIKNKYNVMLVLDDRLSVCRLWHRLGLNLLRAGDPDASF